MDWKRYHIGDGCLCWQFGESIDSQLSRRVIYAYRLLKSRVKTGGLDLLDVVPSYNALAVYYDPAVIDAAGLIAGIDALMAGLPEAIEAFEGKTHVLPVHYNGPDLERVSRHCKLTLSEVIDRHCAATYHVAMIGFKPHFPYLIGLDPHLETPRLEAPRTVVPAGSVAIGGAQTGVYPSESPGGWNIIGVTDPRLLIPLEPGDTIIFRKQMTGNMPL